jgi:hypothetical protein
MPVVSIPLRSRRRERAQLFQKLQHAIPAVPLVLAGLRGIQEGAHGFALGLAIGELVVSALLLRTMVKEIASLRRPDAEGGHGGHAAHGVDWFDVLASGVLTAEALEHWHVHQHLPRPTILLALVTLGLGLFHGRIAAFTERRRALRMDADGIRVAGRFFRGAVGGKFAASWPDVERIELDDRTARIIARDGRERRIDLTDLRNAGEVREALLAAQERLAALQPAPPTPV